MKFGIIFVVFIIVVFLFLLFMFGFLDKSKTENIASKEACLQWDENTSRCLSANSLKDKLRNFFTW